mmetsp:Transcript_105228/g.282809  ORF Transcript_105228/g.282809 Transcript_105228/m.282809 type:complete len:248 (+) Transcript_105228:112-855(+)
MTPAVTLLASSGSMGAAAAEATRAHGESPAGCQVLGDTFGFVVQGVLFGVVMCTMLTKWWFEKPRRQFVTFALDSSKQVVGAGAIHVMNMLCAITFAKNANHASDECAWYWVNIMIDTTFGVVVCYGLLKLTELLFGYDSGHYGKSGGTGIDWESSPEYKKWAWQICVWCVITGIMKLVVVLMMLAATEFWVKVSVAATHWIVDHQTRLIFVMVVTPTVMNIFQFCVQDSFLKYQKLATATEGKAEV